MMLNKKFLLLVLVSLLSITLVSAGPLENDCIYYFHGQECDECAPLEGFFTSLEEDYPGLKLEKYEVYHNYNNFELLQDYYKAYNVNDDSQVIPIVFLEDTYLIGQTSILSFLEDRLDDDKSSFCPSLEGTKFVGIAGEGNTKNILEKLNFFSITANVIDNIFKPGFVALLLILLAIASLTKDKEDLMKLGIIYVLGVYLAYFLFSLGLFDKFYSSQLQLFFYKTVGFFAVIFGLAGIKNFSSVVNIIKNGIPQDLMTYLKKILTFLLSPVGLFLISFIGAFFTFASVSPLFYLMRGLFSDNFLRGSVLPLMMFYLLLLALSFVVLLLLFNYLRKNFNKPKDDKKKADKNYGDLLDLSVRIIILFVGLILIFV